MASHSSLNHIYRTVWNEALGAMVAVAENATSHPGGTAGVIGIRAPVGFGNWARLGQLALAIALGWAFAPHAFANPTGGVVVAGQATMSTNGNTLTVTTKNAVGSQYSAINWQSFSILAGSTTRIEQPDAASLSLNRVVTNTPSVLFGTLSSNGHVVLVNQSGIAVGAGSVVDTAGFTASALNMTDADAAAGRLRFGGAALAPATGQLTVKGNIIGRGGDVVLIAPSIELAQSAVVESRGGSVVLAAGQSVEVTGRGLEGITLQVQAPTDQAINLGTLKGDAVGIFAGTLKHSGLIQATQASVEGGRVVLKASGDAYIEGNGKVSATSTEGRGGQVSVLGNRVALTDNAHIDVSGASGGGTVLVGGDYQGRNPEVQNAAVSYVGKDTRIVADATNSGDGGKVIIWADDTTRSYGNVSARGGADGGNGGFVETSGHRYLDFQGKVDTRAPLGMVGSLLLDPSDITINAVGPDATIAGLGSGTLTSSPTLNSTMTWATINNQLGFGDLVITTDAGSTSGSGNINVDATGSLTNANVLTLKAQNNINIGIGVAVNLAADVNLIAGWTGVTGSAVIPDAGMINFGAASSLTTPGKVWLNAGDNVTQASDSVITANSMVVTTSAASSTNPVNLLGANQVGTLAGSMTGVNARFEYWSGAAGVTVGTVTTPSGTTVVGVTTNNGDIVLKGASSGSTVVNANVNGGTGVTSIKQLGTGSTTINAGMTVTGDTVQLETVATSSTLVANGEIAAGTGGATLNVPGGITVNGITSVGGLSMTSANKPITQAGSNPIVVTGATTVSAGTGDIILTTAGNNFSTISLSGGSVQVKDSNAMNVTSLASGANKMVVLVAGGALTLPATVINTGTGNLELVSGTTLTPQNDVIGTNIKLVGTTGVDVEFNVTASGTLDMSASVGSVTQNTIGTGSGVISVTGATTVNAGFGVTLAKSTNDFSSIAVSQTNANAVSLVDANALALNTISSSGGSVTIAAAGAVTQSSGTIDTRTVGAGTGGSVDISGSSVTLDAVNVDGKLAYCPDGCVGASGNVLIQAKTGNLSVGAISAKGGDGGTASPLGSASNGGNGGNVTLSASGGVTLTSINVQGGAAGTTGTGTASSGTAGRWLVYAASPSVVNKNGMTSAFRHYNATYSNYATPTESGNGFIYASTAPSGPISINTVKASGTAGNVYGTAPTATYSYTLGTSGIDLEDITGAATFTPTISSATAAGSYTVSYLGGLIANSTTLSGPVTSSPVVWGAIGAGSGVAYTVAQAPLTVTADNASKVFGTTKTFAGTEFTASGLQFGQTIGSVTLTSAGAASTASVAGGPYPIMPSNATGGTFSASNYSISYVNGSLAVTPAPLTVITGALQGSISKTYDGTTTATLTPANYLLTGWAASDGATVTKTVGTYDTTNAGTAKTVTVSLVTGDYSPTGSTVLSNYSLPSSITGNLGVISKANATVTANDATKIFGTTLTFAGSEFSTSGLKLSETIGSVSLSSAGAASTATVVGGPYSIVPTGASGGTFDANNYVINYVNGTLTVDPAAVIAVTSSLTGTTSKVYDGTNIATLTPSNFSLVGFVNGDSASVTKSSGTYASKNVGSNIGVMTALSPADFNAAPGTLLSNYSLPSSATGSIGFITPKGLTVSGITAANKVYDGKVDATPITVGAAFNGLISGDSVTVGGVNGAFSDKNVGLFKQVQFSGLSLAGADAANYALESSGIATANANISVRPESTWTGAVSNLWSDPGNWDALPDGANVAAVSIPAGSGSVVFDGLNTNFQSLSSGRTLELRGGQLQVAGALTAAGYDQSGGSLSGVGSLRVNGGFNQSGGSIDMSAIDVVTPAGGIVFSNLKAPTVSLTASAGSITQLGGVTASSLTTRSVGGTVLNDPANRIGSFTASNTGSGNVELNNVGVISALNITNSGGSVIVNNAGGVATKSVTASGAVSITANSPLDIGQGGVFAGGNILLAATNMTSSGNMTVNGTVNSSGGSVTLNVANNLTQNSTVFGAAGVTAVVGGTLTIGAGASTGATPVSYTVAGVAATPPPIAFPPGGMPTTPTTPVSPIPGDLVFNAVAQTNLVTTFLDKFEVAVNNQNDNAPGKDKTQNELVLEGETCRP